MEVEARFLGLWGFFSHRLHRAGLPDAAAAGPTATLDVYFGCPIFWNSSPNEL